MNHPHEQQAAAMARAGELPDGEQLRECINSGQVSAAQVVAHHDEFACPYCYDAGFGPTARALARDAAAQAMESAPLHDLNSARRELGKWLNEEQLKPVDRQALAVVLAHAQESVAHYEVRDFQTMPEPVTDVEGQRAIRGNSVLVPANKLKELQDALAAERAEVARLQKALDAWTAIYAPGESHE